MFPFYNNHSKNSFLDFKDAFHFKLLLFHFEKNANLMIPPKKYLTIPFTINTNFQYIDNRIKYEKILKDSNSLYEKLKFFIYIYHQNRFQEDFATNNYLKHLMKTFIFINKKLIFFP